MLDNVPCACVCLSQGNKWWMNADEPWQALACCTEIANAVRSPDPTQFISHFPVHQVPSNTLERIIRMSGSISSQSVL